MELKGELRWFAIFRQLVVPIELGNRSKPFFDMRHGFRDISPRRKPNMRDRKRAREKEEGQ